MKTIFQKRRGISLKGKTLFDNLFRNGRFCRGRNISVKYLLSRDSSFASKGVVCISSSLGKSVVRNRFRRICRSLLYSVYPNVQHGYHFAILPKREFFDYGHKERERDFLGLF